MKILFLNPKYTQKNILNPFLYDISFSARFFLFFLLHALYKLNEKETLKSTNSKVWRKNELIIFTICLENIFIQLIVLVIIHFLVFTKFSECIRKIVKCHAMKYTKEEV